MGQEDTNVGGSRHQSAVFLLGETRVGPNCNRKPASKWARALEVHGVSFGSEGCNPLRRFFRGLEVVRVGCTLPGASFQHNISGTVLTSDSKVLVEDLLMSARDPRSAVSEVASLCFVVFISGVRRHAGYWALFLMWCKLERRNIQPSAVSVNERKWGHHVSHAFVCVWGRKLATTMNSRRQEVPEENENRDVRNVIKSLKPVQVC